MRNTEVLSESLLFFACIILIQYSRFDIDNYLAIDSLFIAVITVLLLANAYFVIHTVKQNKKTKDRLKIIMTLKMEESKK